MAASTCSAMQIMRASRPSFRNAHEKAAFVVHASFMASGYFLRATGPPAFTEDVFSSTSTEIEVGIDTWNESDDDNYAFVYSNPDISPKKVLVKCLALNGKLLVDALREGDSDLLHLEFEIADYVLNDGGKNGNYDLMFKDFKKLVKTINDEIVSKLNGSSSDKSSSEEIFANREESVEPNPQPYIVPRIPNSAGGLGFEVVGPNDARFFPGFRFDPYGPPGIPGFEPNRFIRDPRWPGRRNHPDLEPFRDGSDLI